MAFSNHWRGTASAAAAPGPDVALTSQTPVATALMGNASAHAPFYTRAKQATFGLFHVMTEMRPVGFKFATVISLSLPLKTTVETDTIRCVYVLLPSTSTCVVAVLIACSPAAGHTIYTSSRHHLCGL